MTKYPFTRTSVEAMSAFKSEPSWMTEFRLAAWDAYVAFPASPTINGVSLQSLEAFTEPPVKPVPSSDWPDDLQHALDERGDEEGLIIQRDATVLSRSITKEQSKKGVFYTDLETAVKMYPDIVQKYLGQQAKATTPLRALQAAFWSGGSFLYVPAHVEVLLPFHTCYWMSAPNITVFPRTLIVAEAGSTVSIVDDFVSLEWKEPGLCAAAVEITGRERARVFYYQLQNWSTSVAFDRQEVVDLARSASLSSFHAAMGAYETARQLTLERVIDGETHRWSATPEASVTPEIQAIIDQLPDQSIQEKVLQYIVGKMQGHRKPVTLERAAQLHPEYR